MSIIPLLIVVVLSAANIQADETCARTLDVALVLDGSSSVCGYGVTTCPKWTSILEFCKKIVNSLNIGFFKTRVALVTVSDTTNVEWNLLKYTDKASLITAIDNVKPPGGEFKDILSMLELITRVYNPSIGNRLLVQDIVILFTDGAPKYDHKIYGTAFTAFQAAGIATFVVCAPPKCFEECAAGVSAFPKKINETYFMIDDYLNVDQVRDPLVKNFCPYVLTLDKILDAV